MLTIRDLNKSYGKHHILRGLNMTINKGDIYGFLGQNGAGKTTTLNIITQLIGKESGHVELEKDIHLGYLAESPVFYHYMTAHEYLTYLYQLNHTDNNPTFIQDLLEDVGLSKHKSKRIRTYSRGMKQRLGIASSLINNPDILLLDEPTSALDPQGRQDVMDIILKLNARGTTIMFSTHILDDVEKVCNRVGILHQGKMIQEGPLEDILATEHSYSLKVDDLRVALDHIESLNTFEILHKEEDTITFTCKEDMDVLKALIPMRTRIKAFSPHQLTLQEIYLRTVKTC